MSIKLTPMQVKLYKYYMESRSRSNEENGGRKGSILFQDFQNLQRIWTAPLVLRYNSDRYGAEMQKRRDLESEEESEGSLKDFIDDSDSAKSTSSESSGDNSGDDDAGSINSDEVKKKKKRGRKGKAVALPRRTRAMAAESEFENFHLSIILITFDNFSSTFPSSIRPRSRRSCRNSQQKG
jgi:transcriptional regulator ATRX